MAQYATDLTSHTPILFASDFINIVAPTGTTVLLDGSPVALSGSTVGSTNFTATALQIPDGRHTITATQPIGVIAYGWDGDPTPLRNVSYGYPAGMMLNILNPVE